MACSHSTSAWTPGHWTLVLYHPCPVILVLVFVLSWNFPHCVFEDVLWHECTPRFNPGVLRKYLGDIYDFYSLALPGETISPHQLGTSELRLGMFLGEDLRL